MSQEVKDVSMPYNPPQQPSWGCGVTLGPHAPSLTSLRWIKSVKIGKKSIVDDLYQAAVISVLVVGYSMLGKKILKVSLPSIQCFNLEDTGKLVTIIAASEMTREYLIKQKILPDYINV